MKNTATNAVITLGDLGTGFVQDADGKISVQVEPDLTLAYLAGADSFTGKVQIKDTSSGNVLTEADATNLYDTTGKYLGTVLKFALPALVQSDQVGHVSVLHLGANHVHPACKHRCPVD